MNESKRQFDDHKVFFECNISDGELDNILTPSVEELLLFKHGQFDNLVIFAVATNLKVQIQVIHQSVVLLIVIITIMVNVLKVGVISFG